MHSWWSRPCGGRDVLRIAYPLIISTSSWTVMNFCDRMYLLWYSTEAAAASMPAGMLHFTSLCFFFGIASYVNTFVAQHYGARQYDRIGRVVWQGVWIGLATTPLFLATIPLAPWLFSWVNHAPEVAELEVIYYQICCWAAGAEVIAAALVAFFSGRGETAVVMAVDLAAAVINIVLDYCMVFGYHGFPEMGIAGAAWATVISQWFRVVVYAGLMAQSQYRTKFGILRGFRYDGGLMRRLLHFGAPNGLQILVEVSAFTIFLFLVGRLGKDAMAATVMTFNVNNLAWVPMFGLGIAVTTMVGQQIGARRPDLAARATWTALVMSQLYMSTMAALYVLVPDLFLMGHAAGTDPARFEELRNVAVVLLRYVAVYCLVDSLNVVFVSALKGAGDTRFILIATAVVSAMPVAVLYVGLKWFGAGLVSSFIVLTAWVALLAAIYTVRFLGGAWRRMRVIDVELPEVDEDLVAVADGPMA